MPVRHNVAAVALLAAVLAPLHCQAEASYGITRLPDSFSPSDINNAGQMAGVLYHVTGGPHAAVYSGGNITDLGAFGGAYGYATAINDSGAVAGNVGTVSGEEHAFLYQDGAMRDIGAAVALGLNASGAVVGRKATANGSTGFVYHDGIVTELGYLGSGNISLAAAINDRGQVVGESNMAIGEQVPTHPFLYDGATLHDLGSLSSQGVSSAIAINNAGQIAGYGTSPDGRTHALFYEHGVMHDLGSFGGFDLTIGGMNQHGQLVGTGNTRNGPDVAFIYRGGALVDLNTLVDPALGWTITSAIDINDGGQIVANACRAGLCSAVRLDLAGAVPEPAGALLLLPGLLTLAGVAMGARRRNRPPAQARQCRRAGGSAAPPGSGAGSAGSSRTAPQRGT